MPSFVESLNRIEKALELGSNERQGSTQTVLLKIKDVHELLNDWRRLDAEIRSEYNKRHA